MSAPRSEFIWMDGKLVPWGEANVHVLTHTLHYGLGVFEGVRCYQTDDGPAVFRLEEHTARLFASARIVGIEIPFTEEEIRQFTREFAQRLAQARELERALDAAGRDTRELREAMEAMDELRDPERYGDLPQIALLQERVQESLKRVEFLLRRELEGENAGRAALSGSDEVPEGFRRLVEEYFRNLARRGGGGGGGSGGWGGGGGGGGFFLTK